MTRSTPIVTRRTSGRACDLFYLHADGSFTMPIAGADLRWRPEGLPPPPAAYRLEGHGLLVVAAWPVRDAEGHPWERRLYLRVL